MSNHARSSYASRIVCLTEETTETLYLLGEEARIVGQPLPQEAEVPEHRHQKVVEIVRDAAGELSDGFHLLRLPELILYDASLFHFLENCGMRPTELGRSIRYALFERLIQATQAGLRHLSLGDIRSDAD